MVVNDDIALSVIFVTGIIALQFLIAIRHENVACLGIVHFFRWQSCLGFLEAYPKQ